MVTLQEKWMVLMDNEPADIIKLYPRDYSQAMDIRGTPVTVCPCGCDVWLVKVRFDKETGQIGMYFMDMECASCGTIANPPIPDDLEEDVIYYDDNYNIDEEDDDA